VYKQTIQIGAIVLSFIDNKDWDGLEKFISYVDVCYEEPETLVWILVLASPHRHKFNNWYSFRYVVLDELMQRQIPTYTFHSLITIP